MLSCAVLFFLAYSRERIDINVLFIDSTFLCGHIITSTSTSNITQIIIIILRAPGRWQDEDKDYIYTAFIPTSPSALSLPSAAAEWLGVLSSYYITRKEINVVDLAFYLLFLPRTHAGPFDSVVLFSILWIIIASPRASPRAAQLLPLFLYNLWHCLCCSEIARVMCGGGQVESTTPFIASSWTPEGIDNDGNIYLSTQQIAIPQPKQHAMWWDDANDLCPGWTQARECLPYSNGGES